MAPVDDDVWIPANKELETTKTKGRKSAKPAKKRKAEEDAKLEAENFKLEDEDVKPAAIKKEKTRKNAEKIKSDSEDVKPGIIKEKKTTRKRIVTPKKETIDIEVETKERADKVETGVTFEGRVTRQRTKKQDA